MESLGFVKVIDSERGVEFVRVEGSKRRYGAWRMGIALWKRM